MSGFNFGVICRLAIAFTLFVALFDNAGMASAQVGPPAKTRLLLPEEGSVLRNNAPTLAWTGSAAQQIEVWIDGRRMEVLTGDLRQYVPVPLSFGKHSWHVVLVRESGKETTADSSFVIDDVPLGTLPGNAVLLRHRWAVESSEIAGMDGAKLSSPGVDTGKWSQTSVPATVLTALVRNGIYPNPYYSLNNTLIPDANDEFNQENDLLKYSRIPGKNPWKNPYWFRTAFKLPGSYGGKKVWLTFNEINYRAEVWLNGAKLADKTEMAGMERRFRFDISKVAKSNADNVLAVAIYPLDVPGKPDLCPVTPLADPGRNMGADADISLNYTRWDTVGWDWIPEVRDRDMGITEDVFISATDDIELKQPYVSTTLPLPDISSADVRISFDLVNRAANDVEINLQATLIDPRGKSIPFAQPAKLAAGESRHFDWDSGSFPGLHLKNPSLWWPAGIGGQPIYSLKLTAKTPSGQSSCQEVKFGVRQYSTRLSEITKSRIFSVNGRDVYAQGGNWVEDMMLNWTASRYEQEILSAAHSRQNFLRVWGPTGVPPQVFFDAADRYGIMIQQDFLNDFWGTDKNTPSKVPPIDLFEKATTDIIERLRNQPSVFLWCGGNEGPNPREELIVNKLLPALDPRGSRYYLVASLADGLQGGGPYDNIPPKQYFNNNKIAGFNSEIGPSGVPVWESLRKFLRMPPANWATNRFPLDGEWAYHDANDRPGPWEARKFSHFDTLLRNYFGAPKGESMEDYHEYAEKAQMVDFSAYRAPIEALNKHLWTGSTGFSIWKYNAAWPSLTWQISDWYQQFNAGFYSFRRALEPLHVQMNLDDRSVSIVNRNSEPAADLKLKLEIYSLDMRPLWTTNGNYRLGPNSSQITPIIVPEFDGISFLRLRLLDAAGKPVSDNFYWMEKNDDYSGLYDLPAPKLESKASLEHGKVHLKMVNAGKSPALLVRAKLIDQQSKEEVLPTWWSDNYVHLLPGESIDLSAETQPDLMPENAAVEISGYNLRTPIVVTIKP